MAKASTEQEFRQVLKACRDLFAKKLHDYGAAWRIMRPASITDQLYIKANRIRTLETTESLVDEGIVPEFVGLFNYAVVGMIQLAEGALPKPDGCSPEEALRLYDQHAEASLQLMLRKNHDYGEAWRAMRVSSYTDLILMKIFRTKQIEELDGKTLVSEGIAANYADIMNYAAFALIRLVVEQEAAPQHED